MCVYEFMGFSFQSSCIICFIFHILFFEGFDLLLPYVSETIVFLYISYKINERRSQRFADGLS